MRIHTTLEAKSIRLAGHVAGVTFHRLNTHGSRKSARAFDVILEGSSGRQGMAGGYEAASWDQWGIFLASVFEMDPTASATYYQDSYDFHHQTGGRFQDLARRDQHRQHRWEYIDRVTDGIYRCSCGAIRRNGHLNDYLAREGENVFAGAR